MGIVTKWIIWVIAVLSVFGAAEFWNLGQESKNYYQSEPVISNSEWVSTGKDSIQDQTLVCRPSGKTVGDVWMNGNLWRATAEAKDLVYLHNDFVDEVHAKSAVEKFVVKNSLCKE